MCSRSAVAAPTLIPILIRHRSNQEGRWSPRSANLLVPIPRGTCFLENPPGHKTTPREAKAFLSAPASSKDNSFYPACNLILDKVFNRTSCPNFDTERQGFFLRRKKDDFRHIKFMDSSHTTFLQKAQWDGCRFVQNQTICSLAAGSMASRQTFIVFAQTFGL